MADDKEYIRGILLSCRKALARERVHAGSEAIAARILACDEYRRARVVVLYVSIENEVGTDRLLADSFAAGKTVMLPRYDRTHHAYVPARVAAINSIVRGAFGIPEPPADVPAATSRDLAGALVCVPGLAFGKAGERLGHGRGYYDRFLATYCAEAITIGLAYSFQLLDRIPEQASDRRVNLIVTESGVYRTAGAPPYSCAAPDQGGTPGWH